MRRSSRGVACAGEQPDATRGRARRAVGGTAVGGSVRGWPAADQRAQRHMAFLRRAAAHRGARNQPHPDRRRCDRAGQCTGRPAHGCRVGRRDGARAQVVAAPLARGIVRRDGRHRGSGRPSPDGSGRRPPASRRTTTRRGCAHDELSGYPRGHVGRALHQRRAGHRLAAAQPVGADRSRHTAARRPPARGLQSPLPWHALPDRRGRQLRECARRHRDRAACGDVAKTAG